MSNCSFQRFDELLEQFSSLKRNRKLHPITEERLASLLQDIYPHAYPKSEPGEMAGGRSDLAFYFSNGRYVVFEIFATVSQVAQDLRHLEQSSAQARIAILTDPALDEGAIFDEYFKKKPRDPFPHIKLSEILVVENETAAKNKLKQYIEDAFTLDKTEKSTVNIPARLEELALNDESDNDFGKNRFTAGMKFRNSRYVIFVAMPRNKVTCSATKVLKTAKTRLQPESWYNPTPESPSPKYWPPAIFEIPTSVRFGQNAIFWEEIYRRENSVLRRLIITGSAEVMFVSSLGFVPMQSSESEITVFKLGAILAECWKFSGLVAQFYKEIDHISKTYLCIGMIGTEGSHLGDFSKDYCEPYTSKYWNDIAFYRRDWSCHSPNLRFCETVDLMALEPRVQPEFIEKFAEGISLAYNHDTPRCFEKETRQLPARLFRKR
jgi:hypothetical protein